MKYSFKEHLWAYAAALTAALFSIHQLLGHTIPVEYNDEPSHTFIDSTLFFRFLKAGKFYAINLFNNFGTPVIGDAVAVPWAPHGLSYLFFSPVTAILLNKVIFIFLTIVIFYHLSLLFQPSRILAIWIGFLTLANPAFFWFIQNHPHQGVLAYFGLALLASEWVMRKASVLSFFIFFISALLIVGGLGINGAFLACMFLAFYLVLNFPRLGLARFVALGALGVAALLIVLPQYIAFATWTPLTARAMVKLFDLPRVIKFDMASLAECLLFLKTQTTIHMDWSVHQTGIYLVLVPCMMFFWWKTRSTAAESQRALGRVFWVLGVLPTMAVYILLLRLDWLDHIPLFKSMDITRLLWFTIALINIYLSCAMYALLTGKERSYEYPIIAAGFLVLMTFVFYKYYRYINSELENHLPVSIAIFFTYILLFVGISILWLWNRVSLDGKPISSHRIGPILLIACLILVMAPRMPAYLFMNRNWRGVAEQYTFMPMNVLNLMEPGSRLAGLFDLTPEAPDQRVAVHGIYGAGGRSIILSHELKEFFAEKSVIEDGYLTYNFEPEKPEVMSEFGVRYTLIREKFKGEMDKLGWKKLGDGEQFTSKYELYENPEKPSLAYCVKGGKRIFLRDAQIGTSSASVEVPPECDGQDVVFTFFHWPGWITSRDGKISNGLSPHPVFLGASGVRKGEIVSIKFSPWYLRDYPFMLLTGIALMGAVLAYMKLQRRAA